MSSLVMEGERKMEANAAYMKVCMERKIPTSALEEVADAIWGKSPEQQDLIREEKAREFAEKYPLKETRPKP